MKHRASVSNLHFGLLPLALVLLPTLALVSGCGGSTVSEGEGSGAGAGMGNAGSSAAGSGHGGGSGSGSAGAPNGGGASGSGTTGASCTVGDKTYASGGGSFLGPDGCNHCSCLDGQLACTLLACETPPKLCGGIAGIACEKGEYCKYADGAQCGAGDQSGECTSTPGGCTEEFAPVCGCDEKTYGNACSAASAGVSVARKGACAAAPGSCSVTVDGVTYPDGTTDIPAGDECNVCACSKGALTCTARPCKAPTPCGGMSGDTCAATEYCAYRPGALCGDADAESFCKSRPSACSTLDQPVCGCDAKTYVNTCSAALGGTGVMHAGPCAGTG